MRKYIVIAAVGFIALIAIGIISERKSLRILSDESVLVNLPSTTNHYTCGQGLPNLSHAPGNCITLTNGYEVDLTAAHESVQVIPAGQGSCAAETGDTEYGNPTANTSNYQLDVRKAGKVSSTLGLESVFGDVVPGISFTRPLAGNEQRPHTGIHLIDDATAGQLLAIYQYGSCDTEIVAFFRVDGSGIIRNVPVMNGSGGPVATATTDWQGTLTGYEYDAAHGVMRGNGE